MFCIHYALLPEVIYRVKEIQSYNIDVIHLVLMTGMSSERDCPFQGHQLKLPKAKLHSNNILCVLCADYGLLHTSSSA